MTPSTSSHDRTCPHAGATPMEIAGILANGYAASGAFQDYHSRKADNTLRRQRADLDLFAVLPGDGRHSGHAHRRRRCTRTPASWKGITWGLVEAFRNWMLQQAYSVGSVNVRLSTCKTYAKLAAKAGALGPSELAMIRNVGGYSHKEALRIDDKRDATRRGDKKAEAVAITPAQAKKLKKQPNTPQGRRDAVLMAFC